MILGLEEGVRFSPTDKSPLKLVDLDVKFFRLKEFVRQTGEFKVKEISEITSWMNYVERFKNKKMKKA